jgi:uncharacterized protein (DUF1501 family)
MEIWQTAALEDRAAEGWLGKYYAGLDDDGPLSVLSSGANLPQSLLTAEKAVPSIQNVDNYRIQTDPRYAQDAGRRTDTLLKLYSDYPTSAPYAAVLDGTAQAAYRSVEALKEAHSAYTPAVEYPNTGFGSGLRLLAEVIGQDPVPAVCHVGMGNFDTHANQVRNHENLLKTLADGLNAFYKDLEAHGKAQDVLVLTWTEFGRRFSENGSGGTDHGTATPLFVIGGAIKGQSFYGQPTDLGSLKEGDPQFTTDFRSVYATVLEEWLRVPSDSILGAKYDTLGIVA